MPPPTYTDLFTLMLSIVNGLMFFHDNNLTFSVFHHHFHSCYRTVPSAIWKVFSEFLIFSNLFHELLGKELQELTLPSYISKYLTAVYFYIPVHRFCILILFIYCVLDGLLECVKVPMPARQVLPLTVYIFKVSYSTSVTRVNKVLSIGQS